MKEQLISFEMAKLANEKGYSYFRFKEGLKFEDGISLHACKMPTQALLQKWLRDKHNIDVQPYLIELLHNHKQLKQESKDRKYTYNIYKNGITVHVGFQQNLSYEQALQEALKLIP